jgi:tricorn protease
MCWRVMRDNWYDDHLGNRDWNLIRQKYFAAAETADLDGLTQIVQMMLGELNGSHLGFFGGSTTLPTRRGTGPTADEPGDRKWNNITGHLGIRFVEGFAGPGLKIRDILPEGPADTKKAGLKPGDVVMSIDGKPVDAKTDLTQVLNGLPNRDVVLKVKSGIATERDVILRPITFTQSRQLLYQAWLRDNRKMVEQLSKGTLGYLHIAAMDMSNFYKFEEELYNAGAGKDGLVIDVRENGGGSTADHLLTALTQPQHAIAIPRGGDRGYPQDRTVYATWNKPIIVLCNQNSFSNAEIFSHAIKTLKRGHLVGVPTAGGVISTGGTSIMDIGFLRLPFRGWYLVNTGEDMELHGAVPDVVVWPQPGEYSQGKDTQIDKAVEMLLKDVQDWKNRPQPKLKKATER